MVLIKVFQDRLIQKEFHHLQLNINEKDNTKSKKNLKSKLTNLVLSLSCVPIDATSLTSLKLSKILLLPSDPITMSIFSHSNFVKT